MRAPGDILLVSCYELGHQPLALASPLGFLERAGFAPAALDVAVEPFDDARAARARFVGISVPMHTALRLGVEVARRVRRVNPTAHVGFYGLYAALNAPYLLAHGADSVIGGEFEGRLVALVEALERGEDFAIEGVGTAGRAAAPVLERLDFAVPARHALPPLARYARIVREDGREEPAGYVEASRGCKHLCRHCPIPPVYGGRFFAVPRGVVLEDLRRQIEAGARHVSFGDPDFLNGPTHALRVARALHEEFPEVTFDFTAKVEHLVRYRDLLPELARLGGAFVVSAVESLNDAVLAALDKGHTRADVEAALAATRAAGIALRPSLVPFTPWETLESYLDLFAFVEREGLIDQVDPVHFAIRLLVPPGSLLLESPAMRPYLGGLDEASFTYRWTHPDPRMDALQGAAAALVERAAPAGETPETTFERLRALAWRVAGEAPAGFRRAGFDVVVAGSVRRRSPRLSESWFC